MPIERKRKLKSVLVEGLQEKTTKTTGKKTVILDNDQHKPTTSFNKEERIARSKIINKPDTLFVFLDHGGGLLGTPLSL